MRKLLIPVFALILALSATLVLAQTSSTSQLSGTITDATGAAVAGATIEMTDLATNQSRKVSSNGAGQYLFPSVVPGLYKITVTMNGFRQAVISSYKVDVAKAQDLNVTLEVGGVGEVVEVTAGIGAELQKQDATVGNVISGDALRQIPNLNRDTTSLVLLQPMVSPAAAGTGDSTGGQVAGARSDQNTFMLDGGDATSNTEATGGYNSGFVATPRGVVPTPAESIEEFRVATNNSSANFARSAGAQVQLLTKRGTNDLHGSMYWYHQNDALNAASWTNKRTLGQTITDPTRRHKVQEPELKDNRYGFSVGGPIIKDKTFIFGHYEGRRFPQTGQRLRNVPTDSLRQGILRFRDASNNIVSYNLATSTLCSGGACDPRGRGISPVVKGVWDLLPAGNDPSAGDGLNFIGYRANIPFTLKEEFAVARLDHNFSEKWRFDGSYRYGRTRSADLSQIDITKGANQATALRPLEPRYAVGTVTGQITPTLISESRFNFLRHWWEWATFKPAPQVSGTAAALAIAGEGVNSFIDEPINVDTQNARGRIWNGKDYNFTQNFTWVRGSHSFNFGGKILNQNFFHQRDDKVVGGLTSLVYQIENGNFAVIPAANRPATCGGTVTTNCISSADIANWDKLYAATLGIMDRAAVLLTRDGDLKPQAPGVPLRENVNVKAYEMYGSDTWRLTPSLTINFGLNWNIQQPPTENKNKQTLLTADGQILDTASFLAQRKAAAEAGKAYNPKLGVLPIASTDRNFVYDPDYNNIGPRIAAAWSPSYSDGFLGKLVGQNKTVVRGGYSLAYDRINGVGIVMIPILGIGFGNVLSCTGPTSAGVCTGAGTNPGNAFRIGVDGSSVPLPTVGTSQVPIVPGLSGPGTVAGANSVFETLSFQIDTRRQVAHNHSFDLTVQRELPGGIVIEAGYVGRAARGLYQGLDLNQVPIFMKDSVSGQTFAQAYDAVAAAVRGNQTAAAQPWFENMLKGSSFCAAPATSCTAGVVSRFASQINLGQVYTLFANLNNSFVTGPVLSRNQVEVLYMITDLGRSNYHAGFISVQKRSKSLTVGLNYTLSQSLDNRGFNQSNLGSLTNAYDPNYDYGPSLFDRRHIFNGYWYYQLPFGKGQRFNSGNWLDQITGGWSVSGIVTASSGLPFEFVQGTGQEFGQASLFGNPTGLIQTSGSNFTSSVNSGVVGSNNIGTNAGGTGTGLNVFSNPEQVFNSFRRVSLSQDTRHGRGVLRGLRRWNLDMSLQKKIQLTERISLGFSADFTNAFNNVQFGDTNFNITNPRAFGVITAQANQPRFIQFGARIGF